MPNGPTPHRVGWDGTAEGIDVRWIQPIDPPIPYSWAWEDEISPSAGKIAAAARASVIR